jgi:hypothetical protein
MNLINTVHNHGVEKFDMLRIAPEIMTSTDCPLS